MKRFRIKLIAVILTVATLFSFSTHLSAEENKKYLSDIRLVMAESLEKAQKELDSSIYRNYTLFPQNLNEGNSKYFGITDVDMGVYIAYTTTENVDEAITNIAVMDMNGGYKEGNMQVALEHSMKQYIKLAEKYLVVINYMIEAADAGDYLANAALRQLDLYYDPTTNKRLGDILTSGISAKALASMLIRANAEVLNNFRSLIGMGVSYNEDGKTYLDKVADAAAAYNADPTVYESENWYDTAIAIEGTMGTLRELILTYRDKKDTLDYTTEELGEEELEYIEAATIGVLFENVPYINGKTLADFVIGYQIGGDNYKQLYPLVAALNPGQKALTEICQFFDVVRYSDTLMTEEIMDAEIAELEERWSNGFNIYTGVDLDMFNSSFAVTTEADRSSATTGRDIASEVFLRSNAIISYFINGAALITDIAVYACLLSRNAALESAKYQAKNLLILAKDTFQDSITAMAKAPLHSDLPGITNEFVLNNMANKVNITLEGGNFYEKLTSFINQTVSEQFGGGDSAKYEHLSDIQIRLEQLDGGVQTCETAARDATEKYMRSHISFKGMTLTFSGVLLCITAYQVGTWVYNYYNPKLSDIPSDMVDVISTENGDRFIHYHAAENIKPNDLGEYKPVCLNAFEGSRWIALYYTKSYEAGSALLPEFTVSETTNVAKEGFIPAAKFGDKNAYDLNTHAFKSTKRIYLGIAESGDLKSYVTDVPTVVGTFIGAGGYFAAAAAGAVLTFGIFSVVKNKKKETPEA